MKGYINGIEVWNIYMEGELIKIGNNEGMGK